MRMDIDRLRLNVHLGCSADERTRPQPVEVSLSIHFKKNVEALQSDQLSDTVCYQDVCDQIKIAASTKEYNTVEHLAFEIRREIQPLLRTAASADLAVHKIQPPIENLIGGVTIRLRIEL
jgi:dihydroneopterin aldolase